MASAPIITVPSAQGQGLRVDATGGSFALREWAGSGPAVLHVHNADDEAWHVLAGRLRFRFADRNVEVGPGTTVFVPAGVAHTFQALTGDTRYLVILPPRVLALIEALHDVRGIDEQRAVYRRFESEILE
jgi:quercetin dioxygenase-like cupin family protein